MDKGKEFENAVFQKAVVSFSLYQHNISTALHNYRRGR